MGPFQSSNLPTLMKVKRPFNIETYLASFSYPINLLVRQRLGLPAIVKPQPLFGVFMDIRFQLF